MGTPAAVMGDKVVGTCTTHLIPNPATGAPQPAPPFPFSAPLTMSLVETVLIAGKPAAVLGSWGLNTPPHVGLHIADPSFAPPTQKGTVVMGSTTVLIGGQPAANCQSQGTMCMEIPAMSVIGTASTVLIG